MHGIPGSRQSLVSGASTLCAEFDYLKPLLNICSARAVIAGNGGNGVFFENRMFVHQANRPSGQMVSCAAMIIDPVNDKAVVATRYPVAVAVVFDEESLFKDSQLGEQVPDLVQEIRGRTFHTELCGQERPVFC